MELESWLVCMAIWLSVGGFGTVTVMRWVWCGERDGQMRQRVDWTDLDICAGFEDGIFADHGGCTCAVKCTLNVERRERERRVE